MIRSPVESPISVEGKSPCGQVDLLLRARLLTLRQKMIIMDTDFLLDLDKLICEEEGEKEYLFTGVCPCTFRVELQTFSPRKAL